MKFEKYFREITDAQKSDCFIRNNFPPIYDGNRGLQFTTFVLKTHVKYTQ